LYYKSKPILIDVGRLSYNNPTGQYGYSAQAHNSITIDDFEAQAGINNRKLPDFYRTSIVDTDYFVDEEKFILTIEHNGFQRLFGDPIAHKRIFTLSNTYFKIEDQLLGKKKHKLKTFFHWAPGMSIIQNEDSSLSIDYNNIKNHKSILRLETKSSEFESSKTEIYHGSSSGYGWHFPNYGIKEAITTLIYSQDINLPMTNYFKLEWEV